MVKNRHQIASKVDLGGSWAPFGMGLGRPGPSFGHFWGLLARFFRVRFRIFSNIAFAYVSDGIEDGFSIDYGGFWEVWEPFSKGLGIDSGWLWDRFWKCLFRLPLRILRIGGTGRKAFTINVVILKRNVGKCLDRILAMFHEPSTAAY